MVKEYSKISPTAIFCARMRAKQNVPFAKEIISLVDSKYLKWVDDLPDYGSALNSNQKFIPFIEGRYYSLNRVLSQMKNIFIVEIAAGLSPRSLEFLNKENTLYLETELNGLIKLKENILNDIIIKNNLSNKNLSFLSVNPLKKEDVDKIGKFYEKKSQNKRLIIIHEGLLMYFDKKEKTIFRDNIKYLFEKYDKEGLWLTSDFSRLKKKKDEPKGRENIRDKISKVTEREFNYFDSIEETKEFLKKAGFNSEIISNENIISQLIKEKGLESNKESILSSSKEYQIWKLRLS